MSATAAPAPVAPVPVKAPVANGAPKGVAQQPPKPVVTTPQAAETEQALHEFVVNGKTEKLPLKEIIRRAQKAENADATTQTAKEALKRIQAAEAELQRREAAMKERLKADPDAVLKEFGLDPEDYARQKLERKVAEGKMTPEQREAAAKAEEARQLREKLDNIEKERQAEQQKAAISRTQRQIENELSAAAKRAGMAVGPGSGPEGNDNFYAIYDAFQEAFDLGLLPTDGLQAHHADRIIEDAQERINGAMSKLEKSVLGGLDGEPLLNRLGPEVVKRVVAARLAQIRGTQTVPGGKPVPSPSTPVEKPAGYLSPREYEERMKARARGIK